eukprot:768672-Hanusia_phi.AAC.16
MGGRVHSDSVGGVDWSGDAALQPGGTKDPVPGRCGFHFEGGVVVPGCRCRIVRTDRWVVHVEGVDKQSCVGGVKRGWVGVGGPILASNGAAGPVEAATGHERRGGGAT